MPGLRRNDCCTALHRKSPSVAPSSSHRPWQDNRLHEKKKATLSKMNGTLLLKVLAALCMLDSAAGSAAAPASSKQSPPKPLSSPPPSFLNLHYDAYSSANSYNGRTLGCIPSFDAGDLDTEIKWTKLAWFNEDLLQIDALDTTYATTVSGSGKMPYSAPTIASGYDCAGYGSTRGMGVIDLRGTPYVIAGVSDTPCYQSNSGGTSSTCFQWRSHGWNAAVSVTCSDGNQRCVVRCGGNAGGCKPIGNMLQLALKP